MTEALLLVGASGLAREVLAAGIPGVVGMLDDDPALLGGRVADVEIVGSIDEAASRSERLLLCVGPSRSRRAVLRRLLRAGVDESRFGTFVAPSARIGANNRVGAGSILLDGVVVTTDAVIGRHCVAMPNCVITHDDVLGDVVTLAAGVALGGGVRIGEAAYLGMNAAVRQGVTIGEGATIGMGATVLTDVPADQTWAGVPARQLGVHA